MAEEKVYKYVTTDIGRRKISGAIANNAPVDITHIAVGDGNGAEYDPVSSQTGLRNEKWRDRINSKLIHPDDPNIVIFTGIVPPDKGGFFVREISLIDEDGDTIYIFAYPTSYKPTPASGISKDMALEQWIIVEDSDSFVLTADLNVVTATMGDLRAHTDRNVVSEAGAHGMRFYEDNLQIYNGRDWITIAQSTTNKTAYIGASYVGAAYITQ